MYTDQLPTYADPILDRLDPQRFIQYRLYRDSTQYINGKHVRLRSAALLVLSSYQRYHIHCLPSAKPSA